ncbi:hypothetical protein [Jeongeupia sp. HS-3]|uniref:hypothetical protein n=1 Tax=Jeongeupia sp. HS-3 TaxID=1009682 RepID=UPI001910F288|nr:hypothetical protein [Jeongeupia sp. HS-3]
MARVVARILIGMVAAFSVPAFAGDTLNISSAVDTNTLTSNQLGSVGTSVTSVDLVGAPAVVPALSSGNTSISNVNINGFGVVSANSGNNALIQQSINVGANVQSAR